jgi:hypothetical protein
MAAASLSAARRISGPSGNGVSSRFGWGYSGFFHLILTPHNRREDIECPLFYSEGTGLNQISYTLPAGLAIAVEQVLDDWETGST